VNLSFTDAVTTEWMAGSVVEAGWGIQANHGGGYSYRLCKRSNGLTEECFQEMPLGFVGEESYVQVGQNKSKRVSFKANRTSRGTMPEGSQWTKNPIPACGGGDGGFSQPSGDRCPPEVGTLFPSPAISPETGEPLEGFCETSGSHWAPNCLFTIVDQLQVPQNLEEGDYVLSFRWDCEQTPQVWTTCSSIRIKAALSPSVTLV
jgi:hypothetical protein